MSSSRGRGYAISVSKGSSQELRRPGEAGLKLRFGKTDSPTAEVIETVDDQFSVLCNKVAKLNLTNPKEELSNCLVDAKALCNTPENMEKCADNMFQFALKSKWNAHAIAIFCEHHGDIAVDGVKFRTHLLRKLQGLYIERNKSYLELDKFLLDATFACEIFHHVHIDGACLKVLAHPIIDYLGMLVDGASQKEVEVFVEQFSKCYKNLKENDSSGLDVLLSKIRKQIVSENTTLTVKVMLLEIFELVLTHWKPLSQSAKVLYESLSKPILRLCV